MATRRWRTPEGAWRLGAGGVAGLALCCAASAASPALSTSPTLIRTAAQAATEPKFLAVKQGDSVQVVGLCIDIMRAIERVDPGLKFAGDQAMQPVIRIEAGIAAGILDAACGLVRTPQREARFTYVEPALFTVKYYLVARADDPVRIDNWGDVRKLGDRGVILVLHGFGVARRLDEIGGLRVDSGGTTSELNFQKLLAGRARFYYHRSPGVLAEIRRAGMAGKVRILPNSLDTQDLYMILGKHLAPDTTGRVRAAIAALNASGELAHLLAKWSEG